jgi:acetoin utilization deacetylase AcuC-like enzyme
VSAALLLVGPEDACEHTLAGHPERPSRVAAAMAGVDRLDLGADLAVRAPREATRAELELVHDAAYLDLLECAGPGRLDPDTFFTAASWRAARTAAGAGLVAIEALRAGEAPAAFVAVRPPGHHALRDRAMGFCLLNNVAVAAATLAETGERVAVIDWDVHHGNGTQEIFWNDDRVLYVSTHQSPFYPGTGAAEETGGPDAAGLTVNIPLPAGATGDVVDAAFDEVVAPAIQRFAPTWVLVSAGFDAHRDDPLADLHLSAADFARLARTVAGFAPEPGRLALFLEGGYDLEALRDSVAACLGALVGADLIIDQPTCGGPGAAAVRRAREAQSFCR